MNNCRVARSALAFVAAVSMCASAQAAGLFRAYLASSGSDSNPCTVAAPCRLLPAALAAVTDGGEIWMLDSANYNTATVAITKSVTILAVPGAVGSVVSIASAAIDASTPGTNVVLRNLVIVPFPGGGGVNGIAVNGAARLGVEDSVISGHAQNGIIVYSQTDVRISNCTIRDNGTNGVDLEGGVAEISGSRFLTNGFSGVLVIGATGSTTSAAISDSVLSGNAYGLDVESNISGSNARASITRSTLSNNLGVGVQVVAAAGATARAIVGSSMATGNPNGFVQLGAGTSILESLGNNIVRQNSADSVGTITPVAPL